MNRRERRKTKFRLNPIESTQDIDLSRIRENRGKALPTKRKQKSSVTLWSWRFERKNLSTDPSPEERHGEMKWRAWVGERQPRARQHSHPSATSGIDEIDCGGCITELRFMRGGATREAVRGKNEERVKGPAHPPDTPVTPPPLKRKRVRKHCY